MLKPNQETTLIEETRTSQRRFFGDDYDDSDEAIGTEIECKEETVYEVAIEEERFTAVDALEDIKEVEALKILYRRIEVEKDKAFKAKRDRYLTWVAYRPLLFVWSQRRDQISLHVLKEVLKYY